MYDIRWDLGAKEDMKRMKLRAYEVTQIVDSVEEQLTYQAESKSKRKKIVRPGAQLPFQHLEPVWQLSVTEFRIFYDVTKGQEGRELDALEEIQGTVSIRAVRRKPAHKTTEEIL